MSSLVDMDIFDELADGAVAQPLSDEDLPSDDDDDEIDDDDDDDELNSTDIVPVRRNNRFSQENLTNFLFCE